MFCENCGAKLSSDSKFCPACGTSSGKQTVGTGAAPAASLIPPPPPPVSGRGAVFLPPPPPPLPGPAAAAPPPVPSAYVAQVHGQGVQGASPVRGQVEVADGPLGVGDYIKMFILMAIPLLNIILLFVWSFGSGGNLNRKNFGRAALIMSAVALILWIIAGGLILEILGGILGGYY